jgi:hypothetical protein
LEEIASLAKPKNKALKGWRKKVFGNDAISLKKGDLAIRHENNSIIFFPVTK